MTRLAPYSFQPALSPPGFGGAAASASFTASGFAALLVHA